MHSQMCAIGTIYIPAKSSWFRIRNKCVRLEQHIYPQRVVGSESETHVSDWNDIYTRKEWFVQNQKQMCPIGMTYIPAKSSWFRIRNKCVRLERHIYPQRVVGSESETNVSDWNDIYTRGLFSQFRNITKLVGTKQTSLVSSSKCNFFFTWYCWKAAHLEISYAYSVIHARKS